MAIEWDRGLEIGIAEIDAQHQELFRRVDRLLVALRAREGAAEAARLLEFLGEYVVTHFAAEEQLMLAHRYPGYAPHKAEHERFLKELAALKDEHAAQGATTLVLVRVSNRVTSWLREHIYGLDRQLGLYVNRPGA